MSLFERIKNKRYDLQENKKKDDLNSSPKVKATGDASKPSTTGFKNFPGSNVSDKEIQTAIKTGGKKQSINVKKAIKDLDQVVIKPKPGDAAKEKSIVRNIKKKQKNINKTNVTSSSRVKATSDILKSSGGATSKQKDFAKQFDPKNLSKTLAKTTSDPKGETLVKGTSDEKLIRTTKPTGDEGSFRRNARRTKITGDVIPKKDLPKTKGVNQADVSKKAQEFTKKVNKERVQKLAPIDLKKPTKRVDLRKIDKKIPRKRPSNAPSLVDIKKKIDAKNPVEMGKTGPKPVKGTVLKVDQGKFKRVRKTKVSAPGGINPEAKKIMSKQASADELLSGGRKIEKKIVNNTKSTPKPNLFNRIKEKGKKLFKPTPMKDYPEFKQIRPNSVTRPVFGKGIVGQSRKYLSKVPGKYKVAALAIAGTVAAGAYAKKKLFPTPKPEPKQYYTRPVKLTLTSPDKGYRSKGAKDPITTRLKNDRATSLPPKTPPSGFYKKK